MKRRLTVIALLSATCLLGACSDSQQQLHEARFNPAPELIGPAFSKDQYDNRAFHTMDANFRNMHGDVERLLLLDKPLRLAPEPMR